MVQNSQSLYLFTFSAVIVIQEIYLFTFNGVFLIHDYIYPHLRDVFIHIQCVIFVHIHAHFRGDLLLLQTGSP